MKVKEGLGVKGNDTEYCILKPIEYSEWYCHPLGMEHYEFHPMKGDEPNWFIRWMSNIFFNCKWQKDKEDLIR